MSEPTTNLKYDFTIKPRIRPRLEHMRFIDQLPNDAPIPFSEFANDMVITYVLNRDDRDIAIRFEDLDRWGIDINELEKQARKNAAQLVPKLEIAKLDAGQHPKLVSIKARHSVAYYQDIDVSAFLVGDIHKTLRPQLEPGFYVIAPTRQQIFAVATTSEYELRHLHHVLTQNSRQTPQRLTRDIFYVSMDGVSGGITHANASPQSPGQYPGQQNLSDYG